MIKNFLKSISVILKQDCFLRQTVVLTLLSSVWPHSSISTKGLAMLRPGLGRCRAPITWASKKTKTRIFSNSFIEMKPFLFSSPTVWMKIMSYPNGDSRSDILLLLMRVIGVSAHHLRLQHIPRASIQTEESAVQLHVLIWGEFYILNICYALFLLND